MSRKTRREYGSGSITLRKDGRYQGTFFHEGKRHTIYGKSEREAKQKLADARAKAKQGDLIPYDKMTVAEYLEAWREKRLDFRAGTAYNVDRICQREIIPVLGALRLQKVTQRYVQNWVATLKARNLKTTTIHLYFAILHSAMEDAVKSRSIAINPCQHVTLPRIEKMERPVLTPKQAKVLLEEVEGHWVRGVIVLALATGLRKAEILSLRWADIDFKEGEIFVRHNHASIPHVGIVEGAPKTRASQRKIALPQFALDMLKAHRIKQKESRLAVGPTWVEKDLVFPGSTGNFLSMTAPGRALTSALRRAGLPHIPFHSLRHSAATLLLSMGVPPHVVQQILGHSSIRTTIDIYGHVIPGQQEEAMSRLNTLFSFEEEAQ